MRLNQFLARAGVSSRRGGDELIRRGAVTVNGETIADMGRQVDPDKDAVKVNGKRVFVETFSYYMFHKPSGVMCTLEDPEERPCLGEVVRRLGKGRLFPVGRLDFHTEGLVLLTNDGNLAQKLLHPKFQVPRIYQAKVSGTLENHEFAELKNGVRLEDGWATAEVDPIERLERNSYIRVTVREGRNRLVRRLFEAVGHPVMKLQRTGFGPIRLGSLPLGNIRPLTFSEVEALRRLPGQTTPPQVENKKRGKGIGFTSRKHGAPDPSRSAPPRRSNERSRSDRPPKKGSGPRR